VAARGVRVCVVRLPPVHAAIHWIALAKRQFRRRKRSPRQSLPSSRSARCF